MYRLNKDAEKVQRNVLVARAAICRGVKNIFYAKTYVKTEFFSFNQTRWCRRMEKMVT